MIRNCRGQTKEWGGRLPVALVFPEEESLALSTLGWQRVYKDLGHNNLFYVERFFWDRKSGKAKCPDSDKTLADFPLICFSLNFEGDFLTLINILKAENIPITASERSDWPLIMAGGPIAFLNPFPVIPSLDFLFVGESEGRFVAISEVIGNAWLKGNSVSQVIASISGLPGIMIYGQQQKVKKQIFLTAEGYLDSPCHSTFVSRASVFRDSFLMEINRGCPYGCRFCAAGFIYRPPRKSKTQDLKNLVQKVNPRKVGLVGTALTDWEDLFSFLTWLHKRKVKFSLSSLRADGLDRKFLEFLRRSGTRSITLAVEGVSSRLRRAMNKHFSSEKFFRAVELISEMQFNTLKLYFILGLPGESDKDFHDLAHFLEMLEQARKKGMGRKKKGVDLISISASMFVPKPWTPLQWSPMDKEEVFLEKVRRIKKMCAQYKGLRFQAEKPFSSRIQGLLSKGDEKVHDLLVLASENDNNWRKALKMWSGNIEDYIGSELSVEKDFVWDTIDLGVDRRYLIREFDKYKKEMLTSPCPDEPCPSCRRCGMDKFLSDSSFPERRPAALTSGKKDFPDGN